MITDHAHAADRVRAAHAVKLDEWARRGTRGCRKHPRTAVLRTARVQHRHLLGPILLGATRVLSLDLLLNLGSGQEELLDLAVRLPKLGMDVVVVDLGPDGLRPRRRPPRLRALVDDVSLAAGTRSR